MTTEVKNAAPLFAALGDETRLALVSRLSRGGPASIATLAEGSDLTRQAIAKHLGVMEKARLIRRERRGRESVCRLDTQRLAQARKSLEAISRQWDASLARLKAFVEE
ncbi:MAG TPA: metalloregulator ArsR/SmtB family transcription factor [Bryobacteraceae bacterium]|jgi:DNA-binding transcriptional ArsR family regulator|nr:metalloregulator ArsR/SmtB family transcription factor [Bryobacteraceae bacterium]